MTPESEAPDLLEFAQNTLAHARETEGDPEKRGELLLLSIAASLADIAESARTHATEIHNRIHP